MILGRCPWCIAGPLLGVLIVGLRAAVNKPFGALGGYIDGAERARTPARLSLAAYLLVGVMMLLLREPDIFLLMGSASIHTMVSRSTP